MISNIAPPGNVGPVNLLDNSNFKRAINQRGYVSGSPLGVYSMFIDRWRNETATDGYMLGADGMVMHAGGSCYQAVEGLRDGSVVTFAVGTSAGIYSVVCALSITGTWHIMASASTTFGSIRVDDAAYDGVVNFMVRTDNSDITIYWASVYEGAYTAETLPPYVPKGYAAELAECQRYYQPYFVTMVMAYYANSLPYVRFLQPMRAVPTMTRLMVAAMDGTALNASLYSPCTNYQTGIIEATGAAAGAEYYIGFELSADL